MVQTTGLAELVSVVPARISWHTGHLIQKMRKNDLTYTSAICRLTFLTSMFFPWTRRLTHCVLLVEIPICRVTSACTWNPSMLTTGPARLWRTRCRWTQVPLQDVTQQSNRHCGNHQIIWVRVSLVLSNKYALWLANLLCIEFKSLAQRRYLINIVKITLLTSLQGSFFVGWRQADL